MALETEARTLAIKDARQKAEAMAKELSYHLGKAIQVGEGGDTENQETNMRFGQAKIMASESAPTIAAGQITIPANVSIVFELE